MSIVEIRKKGDVVNIATLAPGTSFVFSDESFERHRKEKPHIQLEKGGVLVRTKYHPPGLRSVGFLDLKTGGLYYVLDSAGWDVIQVNNFHVVCD